MSKEFRLSLKVALPAEAFAEAAALVAIQPVVKSFVETLNAAGIKANIEHEVVNPRGKKAKAPTTPRAVA